MPTIPIDPSLARPSSPYGPRGAEMHAGIDLAAPEGTPVYAWQSGPVRLVSLPGEMDRYGLAIVLGPHPDGRFSLYAHLSACFVRAGELVQEGQEIGAVGRTAGTRAEPGRVFTSSGAHLHFEILRKWPPSARKEDREDPSEILALWPNAALFRAPSAKATAAGGGFLLLAAIYWYTKTKRDRGHLYRVS